jgi:tetratricopeptide (TPR) repeat protein
VIKSLIERAQGNPYYLEELLHYLFDQGLGPESGRAIGVPELPSTLHSLILSRIDRLEESQKTTLKVASVIGRIFGAELLAAVHPRPDVERVRGELREFERLELTRLDRPEPDLSYLFRQVVIQEVAYESMSFATRASLHQQVGLFLERRHAHELDQQADLLAHHFDRSPDQDRRRIYLLRAGELAQARYANSAAIDYYQRVLALLPPEDRISVQLKYGGVLELVGRWDEAGKVYAEALAQAQIRVDRHACARCQAAMGDLERKRGAYAEAKHRLADARQGFQDLGDEAGLAETLQTAGTIAAQLGDYDEAADLYSSSLQRWSHLGNDPRTASLLSNSAIVCLYRGQLEQARALHEQALDLRRKIGDRRAIANSLNNLGLVLREQGAYADSRRMIEESLMRYRELGDRWNVANSLASLAEVSLDQEDYRATHRFLTESLEIDRELGDRYALAFVLEIAAMLAAALGQPRGAVQLAATASRLRIALGAALSPTEQTHLDQALAKAVGQLSETERRSAFDDCGDLPPDQIMERVLLELQPPDQAT